jgi:hypothetical protein
MRNVSFAAHVPRSPERVNGHRAARLIEELNCQLRRHCKPPVMAIKSAVTGE